MNQESLSLANLPNELILLILSQLHGSPKSLINSNVETDFSSHLKWFVETMPLINKKFNILSKELVYQMIIMRTPGDLKTIYYQLNENTGLRKFVKCLDLQEFELDHLYNYEPVSSEMFLSLLKMCPNLKYIYYSSVLDYLLNKDILNYIFFAGNKIETFDISGISCLNSNMFQNINNTEDNNHSSKLKSLSFYDSQSIPEEFFNSLFPYLVNIERLDLSNIRISDNSIIQLPIFQKLTHLSLGCCNLNKNDIFDYFINQKNLSTTLTWLNLESNSFTNAISANELLIILNSLIPGATSTVASINSSSEDLTQLQTESIMSIESLNFGKSSNNMLYNFSLKYLNLNGRGISYTILKFIKKYFKGLEALHLHGSNVDMDGLNKFLKNEQSKFDALHDENTEKLDSLQLVRSVSKIKYLSISDNSNVNEESIFDLLENSNSIECFEISPYIANRLTHSDKLSDNWKLVRTQYRAWLFKGDSVKGDSGTLMKFQGGKTSLFNHQALKYAYNKINTGVGEFTIRKDSIYNDFGLNMCVGF